MNAQLNKYNKKQLYRILKDWNSAWGMTEKELNCFTKAEYIKIITEELNGDEEGEEWFADLITEEWLALTTTTDTPQKIDGLLDTPQKIDEVLRVSSKGKTNTNTNRMTAQLNESKPVYFPTELWDEIKSYIPAPEPPFVRCMDALNEWTEIVLPHLSKKEVAQELRDWKLWTSFGHLVVMFEEMTDPKDNRYKRETRKSLCEMFRYVRYKIRDDLAEWAVGGLYTYDGQKRPLNNNIDIDTAEGYWWNPKTNIDPAIIIAYRETYKRLKNEINEYRRLIV
jgi:hypothetical protein